MFGDRPALSPPEIFYQRMLAGDPTEAAEKAEQFLKERSLAAYYDEVAIRACGSPSRISTAPPWTRRGSRVSAIPWLNSSTISRNRTMVVPSETIGRSTPKRSMPSRPSRRPATSRISLCSMPRPSRNDFAAKMPCSALAAEPSSTKPLPSCSRSYAVRMAVGSRVEGPEASSTANIVRLDTSGVALVCLSYIGDHKPGPSALRGAPASPQVAAGIHHGRMLGGGRRQHR